MNKINIGLRKKEEEYNLIEHIINICVFNQADSTISEVNDKTFSFILERVVKDLDKNNEFSLNPNISRIEFELKNGNNYIISKFSTYSKKETLYIKL